MVYSPSLLNKYIVHMIDDNKISISTRQMKVMVNLIVSVITI